MFPQAISALYIINCAPGSGAWRNMHSHRWTPSKSACFITANTNLTWIRRRCRPCSGSLWCPRDDDAEHAVSRALQKGANCASDQRQTPLPTKDNKKSRVAHPHLLIGSNFCFRSLRKKQKNQDDSRLDDSRTFSCTFSGKGDFWKEFVIGCYLLLVAICSPACTDQTALSRLC